MDVFQGLASFVLGKLKDSTIALWWKLLFELLFSGVLAYYIVSGSVLLHSQNWMLAVAWGRVTAAVCMLVVFQKESSRITKGMLIVIPAELVKALLTTDIETIQKPK